jgi:putative hydrolase of the HAD superfamily
MAHMTETSALCPRGTRALVLDFGGVITQTLFETHASSERALNLPEGTLTWRGPFDPASDPLWRDMQDDKLSERDYWMARTRQVGRLVGEDWDRMETLVNRTRGADLESVIRPEAVAAIEKARKAGCLLAILSNELDLFYGTGFRDRLPLLKGFDVIVDATYTGILKPDARAYAMCADRLGLEASACVFVDDQLRNVDGARRVGMQALHFDVTQPAESYRRVLDLLGVCTASCP